VTSDELAIISQLDTLIFRSEVLLEIQRIADELSQEIQAKPTAAYVRAELSLALFGVELPKGIKSSNVYVIRPGVSSGLERHPNSHQRSMSLAASGTFVLGSPEQRQRRAITCNKREELRSRWVSIPPDTWHEAIAGEEHWTVITFHTAPDKEIVNERM
jgi:hypothetical protein